MFTRVHIRKHERGLRFRYGDFTALLGPGTYRVWSQLWSASRDTIQVRSTLDSSFEHELLDTMLSNDDLRAALVVVDLSEGQRALVWKDGRLEDILGPGRYAYWREPYRIEVEVHEASSLRFEHDKVEAILRFNGADRWLTSAYVEPTQDLLLTENGRRVDRLGPGKWVFWKGASDLSWTIVDRREQVLDITGQEILTRDKVSLRLNLIASYVVVDPEKATLTVNDHAKAVYRDAQLMLRAAVGVRTLDALLSDKESVGEDVMAELSRRTAAYGIEIKSIGLKDVILPGEMKTILNQVIEAEKRAQANVIQRREETAAARSQANTAKLLAENPQLARMKELEHLQAILEGAEVSFVLGSGNLLGQLRSLTKGPPEASSAP